MNRGGLSNLPLYPNPTIRKPIAWKAKSWTHACLWGFGCCFLATWIASVVVWIVRGVHLDPSGLNLLFGIILLVLAAQQRRIDRLDRRVSEL